MDEIKATCPKCKQETITVGIERDGKYIVDRWIARQDCTCDLFPEVRNRIADRAIRAA